MSTFHCQGPEAPASAEISAPAADDSATDDSAYAAPSAAPGGPGVPRAREVGGTLEPEPTRFGDWEKNGRCIDF
ncbi:MAG TPA: DUF1674 domain-containing protein [Steroidobacteraceae bacterium]|nr:DUF1674 domain-containing protein [Steroidobacteraceae bacterium]